MGGGRRNRKKDGTYKRRLKKWQRRLARSGVQIVRDFKSTLKDSRGRTVPQPPPFFVNRQIPIIAAGLAVHLLRPVPPFDISSTLWTLQPYCVQTGLTLEPGCLLTMTILTGVGQHKWFGETRFLCEWLHLHRLRGSDVSSSLILTGAWNI